MTQVHSAAQAPLSLNLLGGPPSLGGPSLHLATQTSVETAVYPLEQEEFSFRCPDHEEVIRFAAEGIKKLLRKRSTIAPLEAHLSGSSAPGWAVAALLNLYRFCRENHWMPKGGLLVDFQTELPEGFGLGIETAWLSSMESALSPLMRGTRVRTAQSIQSSPEPDRALIKEINYPRSTRPSWLRLGPELRCVAWLGDRDQGDTTESAKSWPIAAQMARYLLQKNLRCQWKYPSEVSLPGFLRTYHQLLPLHLSGTQFLAEMANSDVPKLPVEATTNYPVQSALRHLLWENQRTALAGCLLRGLTKKFDETAAQLVGQLLLHSHEERRTLGWDCQVSDQMIDTLVDLGPKRGIYGARLSCWGNSGCVVVILFHRRAWRTLKGLRHQLYFSTEGPWPFLS